MKAPTTLREAEEVASRFITQQTKLEELIARRDRGINRIQQRFAPAIADAKTALEIDFEALEVFAQENEALFAEVSAVKLGVHEIGYTPGKWKLEVDKTTDEDAAIEQLEAMVTKGKEPEASASAVKRGAIAEFFLRSSVALDKKRCLEESKKPEALSLMGQVGIFFSRPPAFFVRLARAGQVTKTTVKSLAA